MTLLCENRFAGAMIDRFGTAPILTPCADGEHFTMTAEIQVSPQFFRLGGRFWHRRRRLRPAGGPRRDEKDPRPAAGIVPLICNSGKNMIEWIV